METEFSPEVISLLNEFDTPRFEDDDFGDTNWLDEFMEDFLGG